LKKNAFICSVSFGMILLIRPHNPSLLYYIIIAFFFENEVQFKLLDRSKESVNEIQFHWSARMDAGAQSPEDTTRTRSWRRGQSMIRLRNSPINIFIPPCDWNSEAANHQPWPSEGWINASDSSCICTETVEVESLPLDDGGSPSPFFDFSIQIHTDDFAIPILSIPKPLFSLWSREKPIDPIRLDWFRE